MLTEPDRPEQRAAQRFPVHCPVEYAHGHGYSRDISTSGLYFLTDGLFRLRETVHLTVRPAHAPSIRCTGQVVRVDRAEPGYGVAVRFNDWLFESAAGC